MKLFLSGGLFALSWVAGLFFLRYWKKSGDRFFAFFAAAFWLIALQRLLLLDRDNKDMMFAAYCVRLLAFLVILAAIFDKNRRPRR